MDLLFSMETEFGGICRAPCLKRLSNATYNRKTSDLGGHVPAPNKP